MTTNSGVPTNADGQTVTMVIAPVLSTGTHAPIKVLYGSGVPAASLGNDGDFYRNMDNDDMYGPKLGTWPDAFSIRGYKGDKGDVGPIGALTDVDRAYVDAAKTAAAASQSAAKTSETNAKTSETNAASSKSAAATSESNAKTSENNAKTSETNSAASASAAAGSATQASGSASAASTSATASSTSAGAAKTSENNAKTSETNAASSASAAATSKSNAATSETNAAASATAASGSAGAAKTSETNAATSAGTASSKASAASTSAANAKTSETNAAASATAAASSADDSAASASASAGSASAAAASQGAAKTSETNAKTSETNAASSKSAAKTSETNAAGSATEAAGSASAAADSATQAAYARDAAQTAANSVTNPVSKLGDTMAGDLWVGDPAAVDTAQYTLGANYRLGIARSSASGYTPYMVITNTPLKVASPPSAQTAIGNINFRWGSTTGDPLAGPTAADISTYVNPDGTAMLTLFARDASASVKGRIYVTAQNGGQVLMGSNVNDNVSKVLINPNGATWAALNAPTLRVVDTLSGTGGGLSIDSYQPTIQFIDRSASAKNSRMMQNAGQIMFANDAGDGNGVFNSSGIILHPDGYMSVGFGGSVNLNAAISANGPTVGTSASQYGYYFNQEFNANATTAGYAFLSTPKVNASAFTMANLYAFFANVPVFGSGAVITNYTAFIAKDPGATPANAFGLRSQLAAGTNRWNIYNDGTAANYFNGQLQVGSTTDYANGKVQIATPSTGGHGLAVVRNGQALQYIAIGTNTGLDANAPNDHKIVGYSPASAAKPIYIHATTDEAGTVPTNGTVGINFKVLNGTFGRFWQSGNFGLGYGIVDDSVNALQVLGGGKFTGPISTAQLVTPAKPTGTASTTGGSLAAGTWYARVVAVDALGGTTPVGTESTGVTTTGSTSSIAWTWTATPGAVSYRIYYGTTSGAEAAYYTSTTNSFTLTASSGTAGSPPTSNTTGSIFVAGISVLGQGATSTGDLAISSAGTYSYKLFLSAGSYSPFLRGMNDGSIQAINSANTAANLTISDAGQLTARSNVCSQIGGGLSTGAFRTTSDIGGAFADWNNAKTFAVQIDTPSVVAAYGGMRWTRWGGRHLAAIEAYEGGTTSSQPTIVMHVANQNNAWTFSNADIARGAGGSVWGSWNFDPNTRVVKAGDTMTGELGCWSSGDQGYYGRFGQGYLKLARYDYGAYIDLNRHMSEDYRWRIRYNFNSNVLEFICNGGQTISMASDGNIYSAAAGGWLSNKVARTGDSFSGVMYFNGGTTAGYTQFGYINSGAASTYNGSTNNGTFSLFAANMIAASQVWAVSDGRLKTEVEDIDEAEAIQFMEEVAPKRYLKEGVREWGFIAQHIGKSLNGKGTELITVTKREGLEEMVDEDGFVSPADHALNVSHNQIVPIHAAVLRNLLRRVAALENNTVH